MSVEHTYKCEVCENVVEAKYFDIVQKKLMH